MNVIVIVISTSTLEKLNNKHDVTRREVEQCFENKEGDYLEDTREEHITDPVTMWFIAPTNCGRKLKVIFVFNNGNIYIKSAFSAKQSHIEVYEPFRY